MNPNYGYQLYQIQRIKTRAEVLADDALLHRSCLLSGGFGSGHREGVVGEVGDELQVPAECLDVAGDGLDG